MKKFALRILALAAVAVCALGASAQQMQELPQDSALIVGKLDNGLTYYIRHNDTPKGQAEFYIAQKVGSALEEDHQRGLAHFLEHMCFGGTEHFPGKKLITWLESKGVKFGADLNAYTSVDETVYNLSAVPTADRNVQDSCLLILHDWSCALSLDTAEISAQRKVIHEEWRRSMTGAMRIIEQLLPVVYPTERYGHRLPIGTMEVVDNFPRQALVDYYHKWYRPDQQAVIVVGDIDPVYIENKIKEMFAPIPMPENAAERVYFPVEDTPGTIYAIGKDKEMQVADVMLMYKNDNVMLPREYRNSQTYYAVDYPFTMIARMLNTRLREAANKPDAKFAQARFEVGEFFLAKTKGALTLEVYGKDNDIIPAFSQAYRELLRASRGGFTVGEYERAKAEYLSQIEKQYNERGDRHNASYVNEYVRNFIDNSPVPGIEYEKELLTQIAQFVTVDQLNNILPQLLTDDNRVLMALLPDTDAFVIPTDSDFEKAMAGIEAEDIEPYKDEMRTDPLIPNLPAAGKVVATETLSQWEATQYTLSNGVKVIVKPTDFKANQILFDASALGNAVATIDSSKAASVKFMPYAMTVMGLNDYSSSDIAKYLQGKQAAIRFSCDEYTRDLTGSTTVKDLPTLMEMIHAFFTGFNINNEEFAAKQQAFAGLLANQESTPEFLFQQAVQDALFKAPALKALTSKDILAANGQDIVGMVKGMTANAADYTFVFAGDIDLDTFVPLMEKYIANIPADSKTASKGFVSNFDFELAPGAFEKNLSTKMETPQTWALFAAAGEMPYTQKNKILASVAAQILSKRLIDKVREEMGATYSLGAHGDMDRTSKLNTFFQIAFPMKPEMKEQVAVVIKDMLKDMTATVTDEELKPVVEYLLKSNEKALKENSTWVNGISAAQINGVQVFLNRADVINSITTADVHKFVEDVLNQGNYRVVFLNPEQAE